uniref:Nas2 N-terminal domain-containing protein n=1 Tax=Opuntia streptacantha TaxID=393608 RepID=A0A7C9DXH4_OPUST
MVGTDLKVETMKLMERRGAIESEMNAIIQRLCQPGGPGLSGNLVDSEGFPRADIDIPTVRADRHRLAELKNDHKDLTEKINQNIQLLHTAKPSSKTSAVMDSENRKETSQSVDHVQMRDTADADVTVKIPFAMVDEISEASPAADDGLQLGDQIVKFGNVEAGDNLLSRLASEVQANQGHAVSVVVMRQGALTGLSVTPRPWQGRGLLGYVG